MRSRTALAVGLTLLCGCAGSGRISVVSANLKRISARQPLVRAWPVARCFYWMEPAPQPPTQKNNGEPAAMNDPPQPADAERLCIALEFENISVLGALGKQQMWGSLVLGKPPAGRSRNFRVNRRTLRMIGRRGYVHRRWASLGGIVTIERQPNGHIRGRFRIAAKQQKFSVLTGWAGNERTLLLGEFVAVHNAAEGRRTFERTERDGMERS